MKYYHTDIESGITYEVSKEQYEAIQKLWDIARPKLKEDIKGIVLIKGTVGEDRNNREELIKMFENPNNYKLVKWKKENN